MNIHEYQAKDLLTQYNIPVQKGKLAQTLEEVMAIGKEFGYKCVLKAQVHAGGRGKAGGIKLVENAAELEQKARNMLGMKLISNQTGPEGKLVRKLFVAETIDIVGELYLGMLIDRAKASPVIIASTAGGMDIEEVADKTPELIIKEYIDPELGLQKSQIENIVRKLALAKELQAEAINLIFNLYRLFTEKDCSLIEINPLVITPTNQLLALDAKLNFDDSALFRHPDILALCDLNEEDPLEVEASKHGLNYIKLNGNIGCMVNGAGLAMATMDSINLAGGSPANFLDVGGSASSENIANAFKILLFDKHVKAVWINIFGGILRCDTLAKGIIEAAQKVKIDLPIIIRLEGTNSIEGRTLLIESGLKCSIIENMAEAAKLIVETVNGRAGK